jgi:hypothetical protein
MTHIGLRGVSVGRKSVFRVVGLNRSNYCLACPTYFDPSLSNPFSYHLSVALQNMLVTGLAPLADLTQFASRLWTRTRVCCDFRMKSRWAWAQSNHKIVCRFDHRKLHNGLAHRRPPCWFCWKYNLAVELGRAQGGVTLRPVRSGARRGFSSPWHPEPKCEHILIFQKTCSTIYTTPAWTNSGSNSPDNTLCAHLETKFAVGL